jgi:DNA ligase-1
MSDFRHMLAAIGSTSPAEIRYPCFVSPKYDGIRAGRYAGALYSRKLIAIPNELVQAKFRGLPEGTDGELILGDPTADGCYHRTESAVMSRSSAAGKDVKFYVFDTFDRPGRPFLERLRELWLPPSQDIILVPQAICTSRDQFEETSAQILAENYEGVMIRSLEGPYKFGRSTHREGYLLRMKPLEEEDCEIIGFQELMRNDNEATVDNIGLTKRSSHQEFQTPMDTLGALIVNWRGHEARVGIFKGFSKVQLKKIWDNRMAYLGRHAKIRYQAYGVKTLPRSARLIGFRDMKVD